LETWTAIFNCRQSGRYNWRLHPKLNLNWAKCDFWIKTVIRRSVKKNESEEISSTSEQNQNYRGK
jgi:hypothetical protein